jgi:hypothetical protein
MARGNEVMTSVSLVTITDGKNSNATSKGVQKFVITINPGN